MERRRKKESINHPLSPAQTVSSHVRIKKSSKYHLFKSWAFWFLSVIILGLLYLKHDLDRLPVEIKLQGKNAEGGGACRGYQGLLLIQQGDIEGAAGTIFFIFVVNQLLFAEKHNLIPWVHLNNVSHHIYDPTVHGLEISKVIRVGGTAQASWRGFLDPISNQTFAYPGHPEKFRIAPTTTELIGNGVWNSYFHPVSKYSPDDISCQHLPLITLTSSQIIPGMHLNMPYAVRSWRYRGLPPSIRNSSASYREWYRPIHERGASIVRRYIRFLPYIREQAALANPASLSQKCLAVHIRHSDKANKRRKIALREFLPYMDVFLENEPNGTIYISTDSIDIVDRLKHMPELHFQSNVKRSNGTQAVFRLHKERHHETNIQVLVDIQAMSYCHALVHGLSAVSEAVFYLNPGIHSVNLEIPHRESVDEFRQYLNEYKNA